jgi:hypothetical protein
MFLTLGRIEGGTRDLVTINKNRNNHNSRIITAFSVLVGFVRGNCYK